MNVERARTRLLDCVDELAVAMLDELVTAMRIPSIGGTAAENDIQHHLSGRFGGAGLDVDHWPIDLEELRLDPEFPGTEVDRDEAWGLVGRLPGRGDGPSLMLNGHVDVVPLGDPDAWPHPPFAAEIVDGRLHGRGACDMKAGLVAGLWAVRAIRASGLTLRGDIVLAAVQGEEDGGLGTFATLRRGWRADACVIPEPTGLDIVPANGGSLTFRLRVPGHATHASRRTEGTSAIEKFWPVWAALGELERRRHEVVDPLAARWAFAHPISVGVVRSGDWASSVPDLLVAEGRMGVALDEPVAHARRDFEAAVAEACQADPWLREHPVSVEWWGGQFASGRLVADSDLVARVADAHRHSTGDTGPDVWAAPYGSDLRLLSGVGGIPTVQYGPGNVDLAHGPDEHVVLDDVRIAARTLALVALDICGAA